MRALFATAVAAAVLSAAPAFAAPDHPDQVERGRYLATVGDCVACHTQAGSASGNAGFSSHGFAGGRSIDTPFGKINAANITPDQETGIGNWSADDFYRAMHEGVRPDGTHLYPAFPYTDYTKVTREDSDAIFAFLQSLDPVRSEVNRDSLPFPFNIRMLMLGWNTLFFKPTEFKPQPGQSAEWNRGAYLAEGLGHCGTCHTPRNMLGGERNSRPLAGGDLQGWYAPSLTADNRTGIGSWSDDEIVEYLQTGRNAHGAASGPMAEVVENSTTLMPEADLRAIAVYLKHPLGSHEAASTPQPLPAENPQMQVGAAIYMDGCQACHRADGEGVARLFPSLAGNPLMQQSDPESLVRVVLQGGRAAATDAAPTGPSMPAFGWRLTDDQVAAVVTYIRNSWGNAAAPVTADEARKLRERLAQVVK
ncbi:MAG: cytochrome c [Rhodopila sp.]|nr:cytochrome c [Rhodopila sp.]